MLDKKCPYRLRKLTKKNIFKNGMYLNYHHSKETITTKRKEEIIIQKKEKKKNVSIS